MHIVVYHGGFVVVCYAELLWQWFADKFYKTQLDNPEAHHPFQGNNSRGKGETCEEDFSTKKLYYGMHPKAKEKGFQQDYSKNCSLWDVGRKRCTARHWQVS